MVGVNDGSDADMISASEIRFVVGRDHQGRGVVEDRLGLLGGLFVSEAAAFHFALQEADHNPALVCVVPADRVLEFRFAEEVAADISVRNAA